MEVTYIQLVKIDHDNNNIVVESIDGQENIKNYVLDMISTISANIGEREYIFKNGEETMKSYLNDFILNNGRDEIVKHIAQRLLLKESEAQMKYANKIGAEYTLIIGDNECDAGRAQLRNMQNGEQTEVELESFTV